MYTPELVEKKTEYRERDAFGLPNIIIWIFHKPHSDEFGSNYFLTLAYQHVVHHHLNYLFGRSHIFRLQELAYHTESTVKDFLRGETHILNLRKIGKFQGKLTL